MARKTTVARRMTRRDLEALATFRYRLRRFLRFSEEAARAHGVTALQYQLLLQIRGFPGRDRASVGELAERLQAKHHGVVSLVTRCEAAGLVRRAPGRDDRRRVDVSLTARGKRCVDALARLHRAELIAWKRAVPEPVPRRARQPARPPRRDGVR
jgi:DNA-binding MarR family transcriptional regulator